MNMLKVIGWVLTAAVIISSASIALAVATSTANEAKAIAVRAEKQSQENAEDFEYFKGKIEATLISVNKSMESMTENHKDGLDKMDRKIDKIDLKVDELIKIMSGFKRAGD